MISEIFILIGVFDFYVYDNKNYGMELGSVGVITGIIRFIFLTYKEEK